MPRVTVAAPAARRGTKRRTVDRVATSGVVSYYDASVLMIFEDAKSLSQAMRAFMAAQKVTTWDTLQTHPIAKDLEFDAQLALVCEYLDLYDELQGLTLSEFIDGYFTAADDGAEAQTEEDTTESEEAEEAMPSSNGDVTQHEPKAKPGSLVGVRVVYRTGGVPGRTALSDENGVTRDSNGTVSFTDVDGEEWSNVKRDIVHVITLDEAHYHEIHIQPREAKEFMTWLGDGPEKPGKPAKGQPEGALLRSLFVEFEDHVDKIAFAIMNGKRPYVDRFVALPNNGFEDDQKPTTRIFGEHCFRVKGEDHIVNVVTP